MRNLFASLFIFLCLTACKNKEEKNENRVIKVPAIDSNTMIRSEKAVNPYAPVDLSPMDMSYYPVDYPKLKMANSAIGLPDARVVYSRPHLGGRKLFTDILKYGEPWRLGANEATELDLYKDAVILDKKIKNGRYIIYCIPEKDKWTIVFNTNIDSWGLHPDETKDIARFTIPSRQTPAPVEFFTMIFDKKNAGIELIMAWENTEVRLPFSF
jgi:hypothetical protein